MTQNILLRSFGGELPALNGRMLPEDKAQRAEDCRIGYGRLEPLRQNQAAGITLGAATQTIYLYNRDANAGQGFWLEWDKVVDVLPSPVIDDIHGRVYWTGEDAPRMSAAAIITSAPPYPSNSYLLGVPAANAGGVGLAVQARPPEIPAEALDVSVTYVVTYVSAYGEEGPPGTPSALVDRPDGNPVDLSFLPSAPPGNYNIATKRLYRSSGGEYLFVTELPVATSAYTDSLTDDQLGDPLESLLYDAPPSNLVGLTQLPGGSMAGYYDNTLAFSEPYLPHAWPVKYRITTKTPIQGMAAVSQGLIVVTEEGPYLCAGSTPDGMQLMELDIAQGCLSKRSLVDMGEYALYASPDGLVALGGSNAQVLTQGVFTKAQWSALDPASMHAYRYDDRVLVFHTGGAFLFNPATTDITPVTDQADCACYDPIRDTLYLSKDGVLSEFDAGAGLRTAIYRTGIRYTGTGAPYTCGKVEADAYPLTLRLYGDGVLIHTITVTGNQAFRLPGGKRYRLVEVEIQTSAPVHTVQFATSRSGLI